MSDTLSSAFAADPMAQNRIRRSRIVESLMKQSMDTTPIRGHAQGLSRLAHALVGTLGQRQLDTEAADAKAQSDQEISEHVQRQQAFRMPPQSAPAAPAMAAAPPPQMQMQQAPAPAPTGGITPRAAQIIAAEAGGDPQQIAAVTAVVLNRAKLTGKSPEEVLTARSQFEGFGNGSYARQPAQRVATAAEIAGKVASGETPDPTNGATHFLNPTMQAQMGRNQPAWATGQPTAQVGPHVFYARPGDFGRPSSPGAAPPPAAAPPSAQAAPAGNSEAELTNILNGLNSRNPQVKQMAQNDLAIYNARRRDAPPTYPIVQTVGPQGEGQYERTPQGLKYVGPIVREPKEPQLREMNGDRGPGLYRVPLTAGAKPEYVGPSQPQQPPQPEAKDRYLRERQDILDRQGAGRATTEDMNRLQQLEYLLTQPDQIIPLPNGGVGVVGPRPLPGNAPAPSGNTMFMGNPMQPGGMQPGGMQPGPLVTSPVQDASGMPPAGARPGMNMTTPGGRPVEVRPAPQPPQAGYQRAPDQSALEPIPGSPADPAVMVRTKALQAVPEAEAGANRVLDAINNFRTALDRAKGTTGIQVFDPRSAKGKDLQSAFELVKIALRDPVMLNTGVLQQGEASMIDQMLMSPRSLEGLMAGNDAYKAMLDQFAGFAQRGADRVRGVAGMSPIDWTQPRQGVTQGPNQAGRLRYNPATGRIE